MEKLADKMRKEVSDSFDGIKEELTNKIVSDIKKFGDGCICLSTATPMEKVGERKGRIEGFAINSLYRGVANRYFKEELGFNVIDCFANNGELIGYRVVL